MFDISLFDGSNCSIMTGYTVHTGSSEKFTEGWDNIFGGSTTGKKTAKKATAKKKPAAKKKTAKKKA